VTTKRRTLPAVVAMALLATLAARSQAAVIDARGEVAAALFAASATQAAVEREGDARLRAAQAKIQALSTQVLAGDVRRRSDLAAAEEGFVAQLAEKDRVYAEAIAAFRGAVTDVAATPQGATALARYNAGDQVGALDILDKLQAADETARQTATDIQKAVGERRIAELALDARNKGKIDTASVIARFESVTRFDPGVSRDWVELDRLYQSAGRTTDARRAAATAVELADNEFDRAVALGEYGDILVAQGDLAGARTAYEGELAVFRRLASANPSDTRFQVDVAAASGSMGSVLTKQNDLVSAGKAYSEQLATLEQLTAADPSNVVLQRDFAAALAGGGRVLTARGELTNARAAYEGELAVFRRLAAADPGDAQAEQGVASALEADGDIMRGQNDLADAVKAYEEELEIDRRLAADDPANADSQHNLAAALERVGDVRLAKPDFAGARNAYDEELAIVERRAATDPSNVEAQSAVATVFERMGLVLAGQEDLPAARKLFDDELAIDRALAAAHPSDIGLQSDVGQALGKEGLTVFGMGNLVEARKALEESLAIYRRLTAADPSNSSLGLDLGTALFDVALVGGSGARWADVVTELESLDRKGLLPQASHEILDAARQQAAAAAHR